MKTLYTALMLSLSIVAASSLFFTLAMLMEGFSQLASPKVNMMWVESYFEWAGVGFCIMLASFAGLFALNKLGQ